MGVFTETTDRILGRSKATKPLRQIKKTVEFQKYLDESYRKVRAAGKLGSISPDFGLKTHVPISIFLRSKGTTHVYGGVSHKIAGVDRKLDEEECFSGSLVKVAAMFAAYKLRDEAEVLREQGRSGTVVFPVTKLLDKLLEAFNTNDAVPQISGAAGIRKKPSPAEILEVTNFTTPVDFSSDFRTHLRAMIIPSNNCSAGECLARLSYPYVNVKLMNGGFFDRTSMKGIWLCGDYILPSCPNQNKKQAFIRIDTMNDCDAGSGFCGSAQNTTSKQMASFFFKILLGDLASSSSNQEMRSLLHEAQHGFPLGAPAPPSPTVPDPSFLIVDPGTNRATGAVARKFSIEGVKIGQGPIKPDPDRGPIEVRSEGAIIKWRKITEGGPNFDPELRKKFDALNLTGEAAVCWQNLSSQINTDGIIEIINDSVSNFVHQTTVTP